MLTTLLKQAVGANARRVAQRLHTAAGAADPSMHRLVAMRGAAPRQTARAMSGLMGNAQLGPDSPAGMAQRSSRYLASNLLTPRPPANPKPPPTTEAGQRLAAREKNWAGEAERQRALTGRHGENRRFYNPEEVLGAGPVNLDQAFRGYAGRGTPFQGAPAKGDAMWTSGVPGVALHYGLPIKGIAPQPGGFGPYFAKLNVPAMERAGPSGPWTRHLATDTRTGLNRWFADLLNRTGLGRPLAPWIGGGPGAVPHATNPRFERVFTTPRSLAGHTDEAYKFVSHDPGTQRPLFMRVAGGVTAPRPAAPPAAAPPPKEAVAAAREAVKAVTGHELPGKTVTLQQLLHAKRESDRRNYPGKHAILQKLLAERPGEFVIDSHAGPMVGLTHTPTRFKIHAPRALAAGLIRPPDASLLTGAALSRGGPTQ